ncbi:MAG: homocysteine S-methyltransferase [Actinomycetota bacterium]|nr:homocysteine S-methyltransferase [Actinomycetota bacterium]MDH4353014.1 homocysteine S-methyltransferase [Actinomycetota bacterium]MDH5277947.1 homocysteine S-methyltransferase [Actinomycetota bacterium]
MTTLADAAADTVVVLDGGLSTELERQGSDISGRLWSARLLRDSPAAVVAAHRAFFSAGADVATTASYQATYEGFAAVGLDHDETTRLLQRSVRLARDAADEVTDRPTWVAASVGPYGAMLADGSEYHGDYGLTVGQLRAFHRPRLEALAASGADILALETVPAAAEAEALLAEVDRLRFPAWLSLSVAGSRTRAGEAVAEVYRMAADVDAVVAVGVNCSAPDDVSRVVPLAAASGRPVVAYPNSGEGWDAVTRSWVGDPGFDPEAVTGWVRDGARLVGGCCRVTPDQISDIARVVGRRP